MSTTTSLTDRYLHAVTGHLPEAQRADLARELRGTIEDTIAAQPAGTDPVEAERAALRELGHPQALADSYRGHERSLIGPRLYPAWWRTLKALLTWVPPLIAVLVLGLGIADQEPALTLVGDVVGSALGSAVMIAFWVTLGFAIAERTGTETEALEALGSHEDWEPDDLPEPAKRQVTWGDGISLVVTNVFILVLLLLPGRLGGTVGEVTWGQIFSDTAYGLRWLLAGAIAIGLLASIFVLARGRWTWPTALTNFASTALFTGPLVWLAARNDLIAWETLPTSWLNNGELNVNETSSMTLTIVVLVLIAAWETFDSFRKAARTAAGS